MRVRAYDQPVAYGGTVERLPGWTVVLPVKGLRGAKRRLGPEVGSWRMSLAGAFAEDVIDAALGAVAVDRVLVVGGEGIGSATLSLPGVTQLTDVSGLDAAVTSGTSRAREAAPRCRILVLQTDLPCARPNDLDDLMTAAPVARPGVLADAEGLGTAALTMPAGTTLSTAFGAGSLARHVRAGAEPIESAVPRLRRDVDTVEHLREAVRLGVGPHTHRVLDQMRFTGVQKLTA